MISLTSQAAPKPSLDIELARERLIQLLDANDLDITNHLRQGSMGYILQHPLISTPYAEQMHDFYIQLIDQNTRNVLKSLDQGKPADALCIFANIYRLDALMAMECALTDDVFWESASNVWQMVEWPSNEIDQWRQIFTSNRPLRERMMDEEERAKLAAMPDTFTIWRGTISTEKEKGMSWTTDQERAQWFAKRNVRFLGGKPKVLEHTVSKADVIAYLHGRGEEEIIVIVD